jgi:hypothetical protein
VAEARGAASSATQRMVFIGNLVSGLVGVRRAT